VGDRRRFLGGLGAAMAAGGPAARAFAARRRDDARPRPSAPAGGAAAPQSLRPARLRPGDTVALVAPASANFLRAEIDAAELLVAALGLRPRRGASLERRYGYLAGTDAERAADVNRAFADPEVKGVLAIRGGWGCARLLPRLDYDLIRRHPKPLVGYSDVTALLLAIHVRTGLVTFHGPIGLSAWTPFTLERARQVLFDALAPTFANVLVDDGRLVPENYRTRTLTPGVARGRLLGGNLTVLSHLVGTPYLPDWDGAILFLEDVNEDIYRVDRMLTHLALAGILRRVSGVVFGVCRDCEPGNPGLAYGSLTLEEVFDDHLAALGVPVYTGAMFGHLDDQFTLPVGLEAEIDAGAGTIRLLTPAVV
jgi:muramoyltetrapeptide carboxypeptidase